MEWIEIFIRILIALFMFVGVTEEQTIRPVEPPDSSEGHTIRSYTNITSVEVIVMESMPMQLQLRVSGEHADGCELPVVVEQERRGNTVIVEIYREMPADLFCPMILQPYNDIIPLGTFEPGDYVFQVNDYTVERTL
ncbi:MAG TPA: hypothetical protein VKY59_09975 [Spirillospora sp.]|nr:hypothetical protein [Spirillospora sp.]